MPTQPVPRAGHETGKAGRAFRRLFRDAEIAEGGRRITGRTIWPVIRALVTAAVRLFHTLRSSAGRPSIVRRRNENAMDRRGTLRSPATRGSRQSVLGRTAIGTAGSNVREGGNPTAGTELSRTRQNLLALAVIELRGQGVAIHWLNQLPFRADPVGALQLRRRTALRRRLIPRK